MTPEQILDTIPHVTGTKEGDNSRVTLSRGDLFSSMQLYADQESKNQSIAFTTWIQDNQYTCHDNAWYEPPMYAHEGDRGLCIATTLPTLYHLFLSHQSKQP